MKTFEFTQKNSGIVIILSAKDFEEAQEILGFTVISTYGWRVTDEDGEEE